VIEPSQSSTLDPLLSQAVADFLSLEARLLDEQRFEEWLALFDPAGHYWVPAAWAQRNPLDHVSIYYENVDLLRVRIMRLRHPRTEIMRPAPRTLHQVTNASIDDIDGARLQVRAAFTMIEYRLNEQRLFAGHCRYTLERAAASFKIVLKRVDLLNCDAETGHIRLTIPF
jgi:benzoate/toluate 1,2-dioxygenase subunit beta